MPPPRLGMRLALESDEASFAPGRPASLDARADEVCVGVATAAAREGGTPSTEDSTARRVSSLMFRLPAWVDCEPTAYGSRFCLYM